jgi:general secretion pathway protein B
MSYILDALRKADAQRERDPARGIHAHPGPISADPGRSALSSPTGLWAAIALAIVVIAGGLWYFTRPAAPAVAPAPQVASRAPATAAPDATATPAPVPLAMQAPILPGPQGNSPAQSISPPPPVSAPPAATRQMPANFPPAPAPPPPAQAAVAAPIAGGLPPDAPKLAISGGVYSPDPLQRMLIVNGQVFNEGSEVASGVALEKIEPRTAILRFRGSRYTVAY